MSVGVRLEAPTVSGPEEGPERSDFWSYLARKVGAALVSFFMLLVVGFIVFSLMPADPVSALTRGRPTSDAQMNNLRHELGLDKPLWERFLTFVGHTLRGDLGYSYEYHQSVSTLIADRLWPTLLLMGTSTLISIWLGMWLGIRAGWNPGSVLDRSASAVSLALWSVPTFWLGLILLVVFGSGSVGGIPAIFPAGGMQTHGTAGGLAPSHITDVAWHLVLPCLTLVAVIFAQYVTIMRSSMIDERGNPYLLTARAKGLRDEVVRRRHAVPNALLPSVTVIFLQIGGMIGGAITVEVVYSWPGLGYLTFTALRIPDLQLLEGTFIVFSAAVIVCNLLADLLYRSLDPRVRRAVSASVAEKAPSRLKPIGTFVVSLLRMPSGLFGVLVMLAFVVMALTAPLFIHPSDLEVTKATGPLLAAPQHGYPLGTDPAGRSVLLLVIWGSRTSLAIGLMATVLTMLLGATIGLVAGHYQGRTGRLLMHVTDWFIALPSLPLAIALAAVLGQGAASITIAIGVTSWTGTARLVRAQTLAVEARPFIERARALGATDTQLITRQVLPNVMPLILVSSTLTVASAILSEATLTFLGLGDPTSVSWGSLLNNAFMQGAVTAGAWWYLIPPGIAILVIVLGFTLVGRAVEHVLNARVQPR